MKIRSLRRNMKAVSPVIATIIIVAIAITMSIAVAYWMLGLGASFTRFEKIEYLNAYTGTIPEADATYGGDFYITLNVKNTGSADATINTANILYNGKPAIAYEEASNKPVVYNGTGTNLETDETGIITLTPGMESDPFTIVLTTNGDSPWKSGMTVEVVIRTSAGNDYPRTVVLP